MGVKDAIYIKVNNPKLNKDRDPYKLPGFYESICEWSVLNVTTWDWLFLADKRKRIVWKFQGAENILCWD